MARLLAIDFGTKRVGLAETDPLQLIASALDTIDRKLVIEYLQKYISKNDVEAFVVGEPRRMSYEHSESEVFIKEFILELEKNFPNIQIKRVDERFTSKIAFQSILDSGKKKKARREKGLIDKVSATIILQSYLESKDNFSI
jgi:putative Holliday junction resolvase